MINTEYEARSVAILSERKSQRDKLRAEEERKRTERVKSLMDATNAFFEKNEDKDELVTIKITPHNKLVQLEPDFKAILSQDNPDFKESRRLLFDFIKVLTEDYPWSFVKGWRGWKRHTDKSFDVSDKMGGLILNRERLKDKNDPTHEAVYYTFVRKGQ